MKTEKSQIPQLTPQAATRLKTRQRNIEQRIMDLIDQSNAISEALYDAGYPGRYVWDGVMGFKLIDLSKDGGCALSPVADGSLKRPGRVRDFCRKVSEAFGTPDAIYRDKGGDLVAAFSRVAPLLPFYVGEDMEPVRGITRQSTGGLSQRKRKPLILKEAVRLYGERRGS